VVTGDGLSARETDVLRLIALGCTNNEISNRLHLSRRTVESHRRRIYRKLGLGKRSEVVRYPLGHRLIGACGDVARGRERQPGAQARPVIAR